jgi:hypothetical protein
MRSYLIPLVLAAWMVPAAAFSDGTVDTVTLKDGRVLTGLVVEESKDRLTLQVQGVNRVYDRGLIKSVQYGSGPDAAPASAAAPADDASVPDRITSSASTLDQDLADRYQVPLKEVAWVRHQGIPDADLPNVFFVAAEAQVRPVGVVDLRLQGWSWREIEDHFGLDYRRVYYVAGPWVPYPYYYPGAYWGWGWGGGWGWGWGGWHHGWHR